jgi:putative transposase
MQRNANEFAVTTMARVFKVSRSGYYTWRHSQHKPSNRRVLQGILDQQVRKAFVAAKSRNGAIRLARDLQEQGIRRDRKTIGNSLKRQGLRAKAARKFKATTNSNHSLPVAPNLLKQDFSASKPNQKWVGDITYLWTGQGWLYLATVLDLFSRKVIGWAMADRMTATLVCDALTMALWRRKLPQKVIVHSDRGSQYCSKEYQALINGYSLQCSMSAKGNCYDNAVAESFFHSLKVEAIHGEVFHTHEAIRRAVFEYIEVDYNRTRRHSANGYLSPEAFEAINLA